MNVYYKRITTWCKWPDNDEVDEDYISYSLSKRKWVEIYRTPPLSDMKQRLALVRQKLGKKAVLVKP